MKFKKAVSNVAEVDMTPMIDIVFQLIAFFMVITNFEQTQADERVILPKDAIAQPPKEKRENELVLNVGYERDLDGDKIDPQPYVFYSGEALRVEDLEPKLKLEKQIYLDKDVNIKEVTLVIRADGDVPYGKMQKIIEMAQGKDLGFEKFAIKAQQKSEQ